MNGNAIVEPIYLPPEMWERIVGNGDWEADLQRREEVLRGYRDTADYCHIHITRVANDLAEYVEPLERLADLLDSMHLPAVEDIDEAASMLRHGSQRIKTLVGDSQEWLEIALGKRETG